jgi:HEPN domain-containing protein
MSGLAKAMWRQAERDLAHARKDLTDAFHEWATYSAQQAAEEAVKAVLLAAGVPAPQIHGLNALLDAMVGRGLAIAEEKRTLQKSLSILDQGFAVSRYPLADLNVAPADLIDAEQAGRAIEAAEHLLDFARSRGVDRL